MAAPAPPPPPSRSARSASPSDDDGDQASSGSSNACASGDSHKAVTRARRFRCAEGGVTSWRLPVDGARLYNKCAQPVPMPSWRSKIPVLVLFWLGSLGWHLLQRKFQVHFHLPGDQGQRVALQRTLDGRVQVMLNIACVVILSTYAISAYLFHEKILDRLVNPLFNARSWLVSVGVNLTMFSVAIVSSLFLKRNWVPAAAGLFLFFGHAVIGRSVQEPQRHRESIGLQTGEGDQEAPGAGGDEGDEGHEGHGVTVSLVGGNTGNAGTVGPRRFAVGPRRPGAPAGCPSFGDDALVVEQVRDGVARYVMHCGRANIFRVDFLLVLIVSFGVHLPDFLIGSGGFNQCAGLTELLVSLVYIPIGYTSFAVFGFRLCFANRFSLGVMFVACAWPIINLCLGGKGCATLTELITCKYLPQIWDISATHIEFDRGFATCTESAHALGGETLLVASTTIAAWVHVMSNFSFLYGVVSGFLRARKFRTEEVTVF